MLLKDWVKKVKHLRQAAAELEEIGVKRQGFYKVRAYIVGAHQRRMPRRKKTRLRLVHGGRIVSAR